MYWLNLLVLISFGVIQTVSCNSTVVNPETVSYRTYYLFHVQNPSDVVHGKKPVVEERGPFVFKLVTTRHKIKNLENNRLSYSQMNRYYYEPSLSNASLTQNITFINIPAIGMIETSHSFTDYIYSTIFRATNTELFYTRTPQELLFGYIDPLLLTGQSFDSDINEKFSIILDNGTLSHEFVVSNDTYEIESWNKFTELEFWNTESANQINGTDGNQFETNLNENKQLYVFKPEFCRSVKLEYSRAKNYTNQTTTFEYHLPKNVFYKPESNAENEGFCGKRYCLADGVQSIASCNQRFPLYVSLPHCLNCENKLLDSVQGLHPNDKDHDYRLSIDPMTGRIVESQTTYQLNVHLKKNKKFEFTEHLKNVLLPMFWYKTDTKLVSSQN